MMVKKNQHFDNYAEIKTGLTYVTFLFLLFMNLQLI